MSIEIIPINGKSQYIDYDKFESSLKDKIGKKCSCAQVFLLNNFPVAVSVETNVDLILIIAIENKKGNFYIPKSFENKPLYFHNQIIPIKFVTQFKRDILTIEDGQVSTGDSFLDYSSEINSMKFGLSKYLEQKCGFKSKALYIKPLVFIQNDFELVADNYLLAKTLDFLSLHKYLSSCNEHIFISYNEWRSDIGYSGLTTDIQRIMDQASKDSQLGYLTRRKIERIGRQLSSSRVVFGELNKNLIIISGKAGTGKSSELLLLAMKCINNGQNTLFLTYNKLLIFDISKTIRSFINTRLEDENKPQPGEGSVLTIHALFFRLSTSLGVLHLLSEERIEKLLIIIKERVESVYNFLVGKSERELLAWDILKVEVQNHSSFDIGTKEVGIDFLNFLKKRAGPRLMTLQKDREEFYDYKKIILSNIEASKIFLADYYGVLENTLLAIQDPQKYFDKYKLQDKFELLEVVLKLKDRHLEKTGAGIKITARGFGEQKNRSIGGYRRKRTLFIDEAQDCHPLEKDILISIYRSDNIVVANGGRQQLIRHVELCNWEKSKVAAVTVKKYQAKNKSYRIKKTVIDFCNFVANKYQIDLNLEPLESEDEGELLFDFRKLHSETEITDVFNHFRVKGEVNGCTPYESLLILLDSKTQRLGSQAQGEMSDLTAVINEYGNVEETLNTKRGTWKHLKSLEQDNFMFWDGTKDDKFELSVPCPNETRVIFYESCRGLEAWSIACFSLDNFFNQKRDEPDAEKFLIDDGEKVRLMQDLFRFTNSDRKNMFAATWVLMAMTRTIDSLYIQINDRHSEFGKVVVEYLKLGNKNVRVLG